MLQFHRHRFTLRVRNTLKLPYFEGSSLRGILGQALLKTNPAEYDYLFEGKFTDGRTQPTNYVVNPLIIEPYETSKLIYHTGETFTFSIVLVGEAQEHFRSLLTAIEYINIMPLGAMRGHLRLEQVERIEIHKPATQAIDEDENQDQTVELRFTTPFMLRGLAEAKDFTFANIAKRLNQRIQHLAHYYCQTPLPMPESEQELMHAATHVAINRINIAPHHISHYSNRTNEYKALHCAIGTLKYTGAIQHFVPLLRTGEQVHIGNGTTSGLGRYELRIKNNK